MVSCHSFPCFSSFAIFCRQCIMRSRRQDGQTRSVSRVEILRLHGCQACLHKFLAMLFFSPTWKLSKTKFGKPTARVMSTVVTRACVRTKARGIYDLTGLLPRLPAEQSNRGLVALLKKYPQSRYKTTGRGSSFSLFCRKQSP